MSIKGKNALVIGSGVAGLSTAIELARLGMGVDILEKAEAPGGHAGQFTCKATDKCARCGACLVEEKIKYAVLSPGIMIHTNAQLEHIEKHGSFSVGFKDKDGSMRSLTEDVIIIASGFTPFNPASKPYGYGKFDNVITNLELEHMLRKEGRIRRPSDNRAPEKIAFVQCVGSRDAKLNHLWCSKVCCGSSLRMARLIKAKQAGVDISFFYMDIQNFGKDYQTCYSEVRHDVRMIRSIPGDVHGTEDAGLTVTYFEAGADKDTEEIFDMLILSVGITPDKGNRSLAEMMNIELDDSGFFGDSIRKNTDSGAGVFFTGTATGPMTIAQAVADAGRAALEVVEYLR